MKIGLRDIEYFLVLAEHRHVGRAADALGLSQPALSRSLRRLENAMNTRLVSRTPKGVELTTIGAAFLQRSQRLQLSLRDIAQEVEDLAKGRAGELRVGANSIATEYLLPAAMPRIFKAAPQLKLKVTIGSNDTLIPALRSGRLDLVISGTAGAETDLTHTHLWDDSYYVYAGTNHRLASRKRLGIVDVAGENWAMAPYAPPTLWLRRTFEDHGLAPPQVTLETTSLSLRLRVLESSHVIDFLPAIAARDAVAESRVVKLTVKELTWSRPLVVTCRRDAYLSPAAKLFIDMLKAASDQPRRHMD